MPNFSKFNIDLMTSPLIELVPKYKEVCKVVTDYRAKDNKRNPKAEERIKAEAAVLQRKCTTIPTVVKTLESSSEEVLSLLDSDETSLNALMEWHKAIGSMLKNELAYQAALLLNEEKTTTDSEENQEELNHAVECRDVAIALRDAIETRVKMQKHTQETIPEGLIKEEGERKRLDIPNIPPSLDEELAVGRNAYYKRMEYVVTLTDGTTYSFSRGETTLVKIAHDLLSKGNYRPTLNYLEKKLEAQNIATQGSLENGEWWTIECKTGTIKGRKVK